MTDRSRTPFQRNKEKTHCDPGRHEFTPANTHWLVTGRGETTRICLACYRARFPGTKKRPNTRETAFQPKRRTK